MFLLYKCSVTYSRSLKHISMLWIIHAKNLVVPSTNSSTWLPASSGSYMQIARLLTITLCFMIHANILHFIISTSQSRVMYFITCNSCTWLTITLVCKTFIRSSLSMYCTILKTVEINYSSSSESKFVKKKIHQYNILESIKRWMVWKI